MKENWLIESPRSILQGGHQQSDKEPIRDDFKQRYNQLSSKDWGSNKRVFQWPGALVMEVWQSQMDCSESIFGNAIACKTPSKEWPTTDRSDCQSASKHMILSYH